MHESRTSTKHILIVRNQQAEISNLRGSGARIQSEFFHAKPFIRSLPGKRNFSTFTRGERERRDINVSFHAFHEKRAMLSNIGLL